MTQVQLVTDAIGVMLHAVFCLGILFTVGVSFFWPWWKTDLGWTIVLKTLALSTILLPYTLGTWFGVKVGSLPWLWEEFIGLAIVAGVIVWRFIVLLVIQMTDPPATKSGRRSFSIFRRRSKKQSGGNNDSISTSPGRQ